MNETPELESQAAEGPRFGILQVRKNDQVRSDVLAQMRREIAALDLPQEAQVLLQVMFTHPGTDGMMASVDLREQDGGNEVLFTSVADDRHNVMLFTNGLDQSAAASVRGIVGGYPVIVDPARIHAA